jgi:hypothetical protein
VTRREEITAELYKLGKVAMNIQARYGAYMSLHLAAAMNQDATELAERRGQCHDVLDALLDNCEGIERLKNESETLP